MNENYEERIVDPTNHLKTAFSSPLFLALCILVSAVSVLSLMAGAINVIYILITIGSWIVYASALNSSRISHAGLAMISGTAKAIKIIITVAAIILFVCTAVTIFLSIFAVTTVAIEGQTITVEKLFDVIQNTILKENPNFDLRAIGFYELRDAVLAEVGYHVELLVSDILLTIWVASSIVTALAGAIYLVMGLTFYKTLHTFHKSVCLNAQNGISGIKKANSLRVWLIVLGALTAIGSLPLMVINLSGLATAGVYIVGAVFISKYFCSSTAEKTDDGVL